MKEKTATHIIGLSESLGVSLFEAAVLFCQENDIEPEELASMTDEYLIERLRESALEQRMVQRKFSHPTLEFV